MNRITSEIVAILNYGMMLKLTTKKYLYIFITGQTEDLENK
jgi:hypothetical protein